MFLLHTYNIVGNVVSTDDICITNKPCDHICISYSSGNLTLPSELYRCVCSYNYRVVDNRCVSKYTHHICTQHCLYVTTFMNISW